MSRKMSIMLVAALIVLPLSFSGCKGKTERLPEEMTTESTDAATVVENAQGAQMTEPSQTVETETIPPTAALEMTAKPPAPAAVTGVDRNKDIQRALKNAGFYAGSIDGKIGPKTMKAIEDFQKARGLKADGKVGPKTWAELEKYLAQQ